MQRKDGEYIGVAGQEEKWKTTEDINGCSRGAAEWWCDRGG